MVGLLIMGGYVLSWEQAAEWAHKRGIVVRGNSPPYGRLIKKMLAKEGLAGVLMDAYVTDWPKGYVQRRGRQKRVKDGTAVIFLTRQWHHDSTATRFRYRQMEPRPADRKIYEYMLKEGFDLPWATIPDPFLEDGLDVPWVDEDEEPTPTETPLPASGATSCART